MLLQSYLIGIVLSLTSYYAIYSWKRRRLYKMVDKFPGPRGLPFFGKALSLVGNSSDFFKSLMSLPENYPTPCKIWYGPYCAIVLDKPKDLQIVLNSNKCLSRPEVYRLIGVQKGLVVASGSLWKSHRKLLEPSFNLKTLQSFFPIFHEKSQNLIRELKKRVGSEEFDCFRPISACTLETLFMTMFGIRKDVQSDAYNNKYLDNFENGIKVVNDRIFTLWYNFWPLYRMSEAYKRYQKYVINGVFPIADEILKEKSQQKDSLSVPSKYKLFIDYLLSAEPSLPRDEITDEINTMVGSGHETSSLIISAALLMLAMHSDVQEKLYNEVLSVTNELGEMINENHLHKMTYLEMIVKETLRLFPVLPVYGRLATEDIELDEFTIPAGANIVICAFNSHRNVDVWGEDAELFKPDRFLPENYEKLHPYAFIPFAGGGRKCIGWRYSMMFMKTTLANLVKTFKFSTSLKYENLEYEIALTLKIAQKNKVSITLRN